MFGWLGLDTCLFLGPTGSTGLHLLLQCFSGVADAHGIFMCLNALLLSSPHLCFIAVVPLILLAARADTLMSEEAPMRAEQQLNCVNRSGR